MLSAISIAILSAASGAQAGELRASAWLDLKEAQVRLVAETPAAAGSTLRAGLEVRLAEGFKTYWRSPGDSGVPPHFDFSRSSGLGALAVSFPFPESFDDGTGGKAWGYKHAVILPISGPVKDAGAVLRLKLDFAVCGTLCIPLSGEFALDLARAPRAEATTAAALAAARAAVPLPGAAPAQLDRLSREPARWRLALPFPGEARRFTLFAEATGYLEAETVEQAGPGLLRVILKGEAAPGMEGKFGPVRLTYGAPGQAFEREVNLDDAPMAP